MAEPAYLARAPITEAVLELRVSLPKGTSVEVLGGYQEHLGGRYPEKHVRQSFHGQIDFRPGATPQIATTDASPDGFLFKAADGLQVVQARLDAFSFSRLKPYQGWERFRSEARTLWESYLEVARPQRVKRIALRYINRIELSLPVRDFKDYFLTTPEVAPGLPQGLAYFLMRLAIPHAKPEAMVVVTEAIEPPPPAAAEVLPFILDIDVSRTGDWTPDSTDVWSTLEQLRGVKNEVFFQSITDRTKEMLL